MISNTMKKMIENSSAIRAMFEEGERMAKKYGAENVFDFSLGNPNVAAPSKVKDAIIDILTNEDPLMVHGYMNNAGYEDVRKDIADSLNKKFDTKLTASNILMTVGAAGGLNVILKTVLNPEDEVLTFSPFFGEYRNYVSNFGGVLKIVDTNHENFQPDLKKFEEAISKKTKAVIINNPNNPTGVVYSEDVIKGLADVLNKKQKEYETSIYLISDEPYRELVYDGAEVPCLIKFYPNTIIGYSFSKSLSLPGDRIGYLVIPDSLDDYQDVFDGACVANRILGFVNAPSIIQRAVAKCCDEKTDIAFYDENRKILYDALTEYGFECVKPQGAFYLFMKSPVADEREFCEAAKKQHILIVQGRAFGCEGYVRLAYCVSRNTVVNSLPGFKALAEEYGLKK